MNSVYRILHILNVVCSEWFIFVWLGDFGACDDDCIEYYEVAEPARGTGTCYKEGETRDCTSECVGSNLSIV